MTSAQPNFWDALTQKATELGEEANIKARDAISTTAAQLSTTAAQATQAVTGKNDEKANPSQPLDLAKVPESDRVAFYGALFAIAFEDDSLEKEEIELIFGMMDLEGMSEDAKRQIQSYIIEPPSLWSCLRALADAEENLRYSLMVNLVDTAWANDELDSNEEQAIILAQRELKVSEQQLTAIKSFILKVREVRVRGLDDNYASDAIKTAAAGLSAVGVPIAAVYFSGSVIGLSAAGITSGLAGVGALVGLGGMVPGIGFAIILGAGLFMGVNALLDTGDGAKKAQLQAENERKAQLVIQNLQGTMNKLVERIVSLQEKAATADGNRDAIAILTERLKCLNKIVEKRKVSTGAA